jgi:tetratricopeptide (TPR) repeat protein
MIITGTKRVIKESQNSWKRLSGNSFQGGILNRVYTGKFLLIILMILICSCSSRNNLRLRIDKLNSGDDKYLVAASIGEYAHLYPDDIKQLPIYAELLLQYGYFNECIELCNNILKKNSKNWHVHYTRAIAYSSEWNFKNSINDFDTVFNFIKPDETILAQYHAAQLYYDIYQKILSLDSMIAKNPDNSGLYLQRANFYLNMNEPGPAIADYDYCMEISGYSADIIYNKFRAEIMLNDLEQAKKDIERIRSEGVKSGSLNPDLLSKIVDDAKKYGDMVQQNPGNITGYIELARIFTFLKVENKAVDYLKSAQKVQPDNEQIKYNLAIFYAMAGKKDKARELVSELEKSGVNIPEQLKEMLK